jgi:hypothetical protein
MSRPEKNPICKCDECFYTYRPKHKQNNYIAKLDKLTVDNLSASLIVVMADSIEDAKIEAGKVFNVSDLDRVKIIAESETQVIWKYLERQ